MTSKKSTVETVPSCPECNDHDYLLSEDGETFLCCSCGFHTSEYSKSISFEITLRFHSTTLSRNERLVH